MHQPHVNKEDNNKSSHYQHKKIKFRKKNQGKGKNGNPGFLKPDIKKIKAAGFVVIKVIGRNNVPNFKNGWRTNIRQVVPILLSVLSLL